MGNFSITEAKCSEEYSIVKLTDISFIYKNFCLAFDDVMEKTHINRNHTYHDQNQMQLALTTHTWCDFVFHKSTRLVINKVFYDKEH